MTWKLFEITPERAKEIRRELGFLLPDEVQNQQATERPPLPYVETPPEVKIERLNALRRRLSAVDFYGKAEE